VETLQPRFNLFSHMEVYNGYPLSLVVALILHFLILAGLVYSGITRPPPNPEIVQPSIRAFTIDENPQIRNELVREQRIADQQERDRQAEMQRQAELEQQRQAQEDARREEQERLAEEQRQAEQLRQRQAEDDAQRERELQAEEQRQAELERQREAEQRARELEAQRQRDLAAEQERQRREAEAAAAAAGEVARTEREMVMAYTGIIHDLVQQNWSRPPSARNGMTVVFRILMVPTGDVLDVQLVQSSGDFAFDRAAETAILRVGRFQELRGMPINMFNENFRSLLLTFRPEDLLN